MKLLELMLEKYKIIGLLTMAGLMLHIVLGKSRWQYYPFYFVGILYFTLILLDQFKVLNLSSALSKLIVGISVFSILISIIFLLVLPMEDMPKPSGEFEIGTITYDLEDESREEKYTKEENDKRKIKYQVWYPAEKTKGYKRAKWIYDGKYLTREFAGNIYIPTFMLDHTSKIKSNSYYRAPINSALEKYPLVIISHGWLGFREIHTDYAEELASNGFIAISIDHSYGSQGVKFDDGTTIDLKKEAIKNSNLLVRTYAEDVVSVLDDLEKINKNDKIFKGRLDLESIGVLGHSTGGGGGVYSALRDPRIKTLVGLDAWVEPIQAELLNKSLTIPALFLRSEQWSKGPNNKALINIVENSKEAVLIQMDKTKHVDFSMAYMYSPLTKYVGLTGRLGGRISSEIQRELILNFFAYNLINKDKKNDENLTRLVEKYEVIKLIKTGEKK